MAKQSVSGRGQGLAHAHGQYHSQAQAHSHGINHAMLQSLGLRRERDWHDLGVDEDDDGVGEEPLVDDGLPEEGGDPNDVFGEDDGPELDFSWQTPEEGWHDWLLAMHPRACWRVGLRPDGALAVEYLEKRGWVAEPPEGESVQRRHAVLSRAAALQRRYIETGDVDTLVPLKAETLWEAGADGVAETALEAYGTGVSDVSADIRGQYFYSPRGELHAMRFLLQEDVWGIALARVYCALAAITDKERVTGTCLTDEQVAQELCLRLDSNAFDGSKVCRWREQRSRSRGIAWSTKRLHFPSRKERMGYYANH